jgi:hypothetical protein
MMPWRPAGRRAKQDLAVADPLQAKDTRILTNKPLVCNCTMTALSIPLAKAGQPKGYDIHILATTAGMERVRPFWESLNWHPNAQMDFFGLINEVRGNVLKPYVMVLERGGDVHGLVVGRVVKQDFRCRFGYKTISLGQVRELSVIYGGVLGCDDVESAEVVMIELNRILKCREVDLVFLSHLSTDSHLYKLAARRPGVFCRDHLVTSQLHWKTMLPATHTEFLQRLNKKHRYWLRRLEKQIETDFPNQVSYRSFTDGQRLDELMKDLECVASKTYQRCLGAGFRNDAEYARRLALEAGKTWLRAYVLYLGNRPCAFWLGTLYKGVFHSGFTGYDPEYRKYELGTLVFMKMVEQLCAEETEAIDYGLGDAYYKQRFGDQSWQEASVRIFAPTLRNVLLNMAQTGIETPALWLKSFLSRTNLQQLIKTLWRRRLLKNKND